MAAAAMLVTSAMIVLMWAWLAWAVFTAKPPVASNDALLQFVRNVASQSPSAYLGREEVRDEYDNAREEAALLLAELNNHA